jgi:hypothetical protein
MFTLLIISEKKDSKKQFNSGLTIIFQNEILCNTSNIKPGNFK